MASIPFIGHPERLNLRFAGTPGHGVRSLVRRPRWRPALPIALPCPREDGIPVDTAGNPNGIAAGGCDGIHRSAARPVRPAESHRLPGILTPQVASTQEGVTDWVHSHYCDPPSRSLVGPPCGLLRVQTAATATLIRVHLRPSAVPQSNRWKPRMHADQRRYGNALSPSGDPSTGSQRLHFSRQEAPWLAPPGSGPSSGGDVRHSPLGETSQSISSLRRFRSPLSHLPDEHGRDHDDREGEQQQDGLALHGQPPTMGSIRHGKNGSGRQAT